MMRTLHRVGRSFRLAGCTVGLMVAATACAAQTPDSSTDKQGAPKAAPDSSKSDKPQADHGIDVRLRRLESITWNPVTQELTWVLSTGDLNGTGYSPTKQESYVIHMDAATMNAEGQARHFDPDEAEQVGKVMDLICRYALESTLWWEHGGGESPDAQPGKPAQPGSKTATPPDSDTKDKSKPDRSRQVPPGMLRGAAPQSGNPVQSTAVAFPNR